MSKHHWVNQSADLDLWVKQFDIAYKCRFFAKHDLPDWVRPPGRLHEGSVFYDHKRRAFYRRTDECWSHRIFPRTGGAE
ncbi:hypothetical protein SEA_DULCIE_42 [Mycobacterium phage Dulcie]|nr:hypothetical protein SEA_DULCIE_42 [Mycobacterium phage Dulcie]